MGVSVFIITGVPLCSVAIAGISAAVLVLLFAAVAAVIYYHKNVSGLWPSHITVVLMRY